MTVGLVGSFVIPASMMAAQWLLGETKRAWGWLCIAFVQLEYIAFGVLTRQWGWAAGACVFIVINLRNYRKWRREEHHAASERQEPQGHQLEHQKASTGRPPT